MTTTRRIRWLLLACFLPAVSACGMLINAVLPGAPRAITDDRITDFRGALEAYEKEHHTLPDSAQQVCPTRNLRDCSWIRTGWRFEDGWGRRLVYRRHHDNYEVRSSGPDRRLNTADDVVADRAREREAVARFQGCYRLETEEVLLRGKLLLLTAAPTGHGAFRGRLEIPHYHLGPYWHVNPPDQILVVWREHHSALQARLRTDVGGLTGTLVRASNWRSGRPVELTARREPCSAQDERAAAAAAAAGDEGPR